jgi:hypothetical protein
MSFRISRRKKPYGHYYKDLRIPPEFLVLTFRQAGSPVAKPCIENGEATEEWVFVNDKIKRVFSVYPSNVNGYMKVRSNALDSDNERFVAWLTAEVQREVSKCIVPDYMRI